MVTPNDEFTRVWKATSPERSDEASLKQGVIDEIKAAVESGKKIIMPLPHIRIEKDEIGKIQIDFVDGRHRVAAYKALGMSIPVLVDSNISGMLTDDPDLKAIVSPLPRAIKSQIEGEGNNAFIPRHEITRKSIREWVQDNKQKLLRQFIAKFGQFVGGKALEFYASHGEMPPRHSIESWQQEATRLGHSVEPDAEALQSIRREEMRAAYAGLVGEAHADQCVDIAMATGLPIHRDTILAVRSGISTEEAIAHEKKGLEMPRHKIDVAEVVPERAEDRLRRLREETGSRRAQLRERTSNWRDRGRGGGGIGGP